MSDVKGALASTGALLLAGVPEEVLLRLGAWRPEPAGPSRDPTAGQATGQLARPPCASGLEPLAVQSAANLRRGRYRSAQNYFDAAVTYQEHFRGQPVDPLLRRAIRHYAKAVVRGLAGSRLKAIFPAVRLEPLLDPSPASAAAPWNPWCAAHAADALLLAVWFMLREIEFAAARTEDIEAGRTGFCSGSPCTRRRRGESGSSRRGSFAALAGSSLCPCARRMRP